MDLGLNPLEPPARCLLFVSLMLMAGLGPTWVWVIRPAFERAPLALSGAAASIKRAMLAASLGVLLGSLALFVAQVLPLELEFTTAGEWLGFVTRGVLGQTALIRAGVGIVGAIWMPLALRNRAQPRGLPLASALALAAYATLTRTSHLYAMRSGLAGIGSDFAHLAGGAVWVGGLCGLLIAARQAQHLTEDRQAVAATVALIRRFTPLGIFGAALIVGTGLASSAFMLPNQAALNQPYGRLVLAKLALAVVALGFASGHRWLAPRWMRSRAQTALFQKTLLLETLITLGAFAAAAWLTSSMPPQHAMSHIMPDGSTMQMEVADPDFQLLLTRAAVVTLVVGAGSLALELRPRAIQ